MTAAAVKKEKKEKTTPRPRMTRKIEAPVEPVPAQPAAIEVELAAPHKFVVDISKLKSVKTWAEDFGRAKSGSAYTASYAYKLFNDNAQSPAALEVKERYAIVDIDGVSFVIEKRHLPKEYR